jgi:hypothetical protein
MRQLHLIHTAGDTLAREVIELQVGRGDEVRVILMAGAAGEAVPEGSAGLSVPPLDYDAVVEQLAWCERAVSW